MSPDRTEQRYLTYRNLSGNSGVLAYAVGPTSITVRFRNGDTPHYLYDYASTGEQHVEAMKLLAHYGRGLSTYIAQHVQGRYARCW